MEVYTSQDAEQTVAWARAARAAARPLARTPAALRTQAIVQMAERLAAHAETVLRANVADMAAAQARGTTGPMLDRLHLDIGRVEALGAALHSIAAQPDPVGRTTPGPVRPNGLRIDKVRLPLGVILMIYEARPNVTLDAAALCLRSGNAALLRGGSEAARTNAALAAVVHEATQNAGLPAHSVTLLPTQAREAVLTLLTCDAYIDLVIPRGGATLIAHVVKHSRIPVVRHEKGLCHVYVDAGADLTMAGRIVENAKVQRPGVCNALETLLVHAAVAAAFLPPTLARLQSLGVQVRGCPRTCTLAAAVTPATDADWDTEYLDLILAVKVVPDLPAAIAHIDAHGTQHTATIVTDHAAAAATFLRQVDASCVLHNASTRFNDGGELGLGAEMGISTSRIHAYGAMGADALTCEKFVVYGAGQVRV